MFGLLSFIIFHYHKPNFKSTHSLLVFNLEKVLEFFSIKIFEVESFKYFQYSLKIKAHKIFRYKDVSYSVYFLMPKCIIIKSKIKH